VDLGGWLVLEELGFKVGGLLRAQVVDGRAEAKRFPRAGRHLTSGISG
jgi:hypothetical protein